MAMPEPLPKIISVDDHVVEPPNVWQDRLPSKYAEVGPRVVRAPMPEVEFRGGSLKVKPGSVGEPVDWWYYEDLKRPLLPRGLGRRGATDEVTMKGVTYEDMRPGSYEVKPRLDDMDANHIEAALCFPTFPRFCGRDLRPRPRTRTWGCSASRPTTTGWSRSGAPAPLAASSRCA